MLIVFTLVLSLYMGWNIGANDAANCVGADVGCGIMSIKSAIIITSIFSFLGAILLGSNVVKTIGKGIVPLNALPANISSLIALGASFGAGIWITIATYKKIPVSTSHSIVGAVAGGGLALKTMIIWKKFGEVVVAWILTPFGAALVSFILYIILKWIFSFSFLKGKSSIILKVAIYITSMYLAFNWGANDVANATGVLISVGNITMFQATLIGSIAIIIGITTWGYRVIETVGFNITRLTPLMTIAAELGASLNINMYTLLGIPVSTSHSIIGGIWGVGLAQGIKTINRKIALDILLCWAITPVVSGLISFIVVKTLSYFLI